MGGGGKSSKQTVGYKNYAGAVLVLAKTIHKLLRIDIGDNPAWQGNAIGETDIQIDKPKLYGASGTEGGFTGTIRFQPGFGDQLPDPYLIGVIGPDISASRGVSQLVFHQPYWGNNPYLKDVSVVGERIHILDDGSPQWYDEKSQIGFAWTQPQAIMISLDYSSSMLDITGNGQTRLANTQTAIDGVLDYILGLATSSNQTADVFINCFNTGSMTQRAVDATKIAALKAFMRSTPVDFVSTDYIAAMGGAVDFFGGAPGARRTQLFASDGEPEGGGWTPAQKTANATAARAIVDSIPGLQCYCFAIDTSSTSYLAIVDNTPGDEVPIVNGGDPDAMTAALTVALGGQSDLNPAHMLRECLTNTEWGYGYDPEDIDDDNFKAVADQLYIENFGLSYFWEDDSIDTDDLFQKIQDHIDGACFVDRSSLKWVIKLVRADYDPATLVELTDEIDVLAITNYDRAEFLELVNVVTVQYYNSQINGNASINASNAALFLQQGVRVGVTKTYDMCCTPQLGARLAQRELNIASNPLASCTVEVTSKSARDFYRGGVFRLTSPKHNFNRSIMRITAINRGDGRSKKVKLNVVEDRFAMPETSFVTPEPPAWVDPSQYPTPILNRLAVELPYATLITSQTQSAVDQALAADPDLGYVGIAGERVKGALNADIYIDAGSGYEDTSKLDFCAYGELTAALDRLTRTFTLTNYQDLSEIDGGGYLQVDNEIMSYTSVVGNVVAGLKRGIFDTLPTKHAAGAKVFFIEDYLDGPFTQYASGESLNLKLATNSTLGTLDLVYAPVDTVLMKGRANRPYPPGQMAVNGTYFGERITGQLVVSWAHRDRLLEADQFVDFADASIGPEPGTTYTLRLYNENDALVRTQSVTGTSYTWLTADEKTDSGLSVPAGPWTPALLPTPPNMLLTDDSPVTDAGGGACSAWNDISGNAHHVVQSTSGARPVIVANVLNGKRVLRFNGSKWMGHASGQAAMGGMNNVPAGWVFGVYFLTPADVSANYRAIIELDANSTSFARMSLAAGNSTNANRATLFGRRLDGDSLYSTVSTTQRSGVWVMAMGIHDYTGRKQTLWIDGTKDAETTSTWTASGNSSPTASAGLAIGGANGGGAHYMNGDIAAVGQGSGYLPVQADIDNMFGWAAWHFGLVANLPSGHSYKLAPPTDTSAGAGFRVNARIRFELESVRSGITSFQKYSHTVRRPGYGYNYGYNYGGNT